MEDAERLRYIEIHKNEKKQAELEKRKMLEQLARDKEDKFGKKFDSTTQQALKKEVSLYDDIAHYVNAIKTLYPQFREGDLSKNCFSTLKTILNNIVKNPEEEKFRKCKLTNPNFHERVGKINLAIKILNKLNFQEDGEFLVVQKPDIELYQKVVSLLEENLNLLN